MSFLRYCPTLLTYQIHKSPYIMDMPSIGNEGNALRKSACYIMVYWQLTGGQKKLYILCSFLKFVLQMLYTLYLKIMHSWKLVHTINPSWLDWKLFFIPVYSEHDIVLHFIYLFLEYGIAVFLYNLSTNHNLLHGITRR